MASVQSARYANGLGPPSSSVLTTRVANGLQTPEFDQGNFNQLLEESLGSDENGIPNLGSDVSVNHKLAGIIINAGIDPFIDDVRNNPFRSKDGSLKADAQFSTCLEVLRLAVEKSPHLVFVKSVPGDKADAETRVPLYVWLIPKLLPLVVPDSPLAVRDGILRLVETTLRALAGYTQAYDATAILDFLQNCIYVLIDHIVFSDTCTMHDPIILDDQLVLSRMWKLKVGVDGITTRLRYTTVHQMFYSALQILKLLFKHAQSAQKRTQFNKLLNKFHQTLEQVVNTDTDAGLLEDILNESGSLQIASRAVSSDNPNQISVTAWPEAERARKRPRVSADNEGDLHGNFQERICRKLTASLCGNPVVDFDGLSTTRPTYFRRLTEEQQCHSLLLLGSTACLLSSESVDSATCQICDGDSATVLRTTTAAGRELLKTLLAIIGILPKSSRARTTAMLSLRNILMHTDAVEDLKLGHSSGGEWCLQSLRSSSRDLRTAAIQALQVFVMEQQVDLSLTRDNRIIALEFLQSLWQTNEATSQETAVLALTRMAHVVGDEELHIILLRLVEYLGHPNQYLHGLVYSEIQQLAQALQITVAVLFRPFWRTLGVIVAKSLSNRPSVAEHLCDLLGMQLSGLMLLVEEFALPYLILHKQQGLLQQFAAAHGSSTSLFDICTQRKNLTAILSFLLVQGFQDFEQKITQLLLEVSDDFASEDLAGWLAHDPIQIACELLKAVGDAGVGRSARNYQALQNLAEILSRKQGSSSRRNEMMAAFLETNVFALVTHFTVLLNDLEAKEPKLEKKRCLIALGEVVKLGKNRVVAALPQICACIRSALDDRDLCNSAFLAWSMVIGSLKDDDIAPLVDQTLAFIVKGWNIFNATTQSLAKDVVTGLLEEHPDVIRQVYETMPSLSSIPTMRKLEAQIVKLKGQLDERNQLAAYFDRLEDENPTVVEQALVELSTLLRSQQDFLHRSILREQPDPYIAKLTRSVLDCAVKFQSSGEVNRLCGQCLGSIGCLDSNKIETTVERKSTVVLSNFGKAEEVVDFIMFFLENVLVKTFLSAPTTRAQGFLAWAMQEFLKLCATEDSSGPRIRTGPSIAHKRWENLPDHVQNTLTPFLTSKYLVQDSRGHEIRQYPIFRPGMRHREWLILVSMDFLHRASGENVQLIFNICCRIINGQDPAIPAFLIPYAALNLVISGVKGDSEDILVEMRHILEQSLQGKERKEQDELKQCSQSIFEILDYMSRWLQQKRKQYSATVARTDRGIADATLQVALAQIRNVENILEGIQPDLLSQRAIECKSFARALFHWEQFIRKSPAEDLDPQLVRLQDIYAQIDEPDGIEGMSSQMHIVDLEQRALEYRKAGQWTAAQTWYQMQTTKFPDDVDVQRNLMECLKESGQHDTLLDRFDGIANTTNGSLEYITPYAIEAAWVTGRWQKLSELLEHGASDDFSSHLGSVLAVLHRGQHENAFELLTALYKSIAADLSPNTISSLQSCHETRFKLQVLDDVRMIASSTPHERSSLLQTLDKRLDVLGSNVADKQHLLGIRRAVMQIKSDTFNTADIAGTWLISARLARKAQASLQAFDAVMKASALGDKSAAIEGAKLMWQDGHHRKAIHALEGAIESGAFVAHNYVTEEGTIALTTEQKEYQNEITAKAYVLLGKWQDQAGQTQSEVITKTFRKATENFRKGEKGWYYLGRHYNKVLDSEKLRPPGKESQPFLTGEISKLVIENYLRSLMNGSKYVFQTLPKILTLWFELVAGTEQPLDPRRGNEKFQAHNAAQRKKIIVETNKYIAKYVDRIQPILLYSILSQVIARICHSDDAVFNILENIVVKVVRTFPQQALWRLLSLVKSHAKDRATRGLAIISRVVESAKKSASKDVTPSELRNIITAGQRLADEIIRITPVGSPGKGAVRVSLSRELGFNHKIAPSRLVVPSETCLVPAIPTNYEHNYIKAFRPFAKEPVTISAFLDEALVLSSLQRPRKLSIRGSDGKIYGILTKPKDDMRKDQRLMEFNTMINRFLKRDVEASKRRLAIRTYAVIPLSEDCGIIEWVDNLKTIRDILVKIYKDRGIHLNYSEIAKDLNEACSGQPLKVKVFTDRLLTRFPPVLYEWFIDSFPDPSAWFNARLRYTRSLAVMSMVGHILGLGDRHTENILFEEDVGSIMHVDFNCLFERGLMLEKPELVPFRLTHNLVDAMGAYGYEGPFRRCCEITLTLLRNNEDALMTILETFLHDPTTDFIENLKADKEREKKKKVVPGVPTTPVEVLDLVQSKTRGMLAGESVPLSVGGYVEEMIKRAVDPVNLCQMYIGWCAFF